MTEACDNGRVIAFCLTIGLKLICSSAKGIYLEKRT